MINNCLPNFVPKFAVTIFCEQTVLGPGAFVDNSRMPRLSNLEKARVLGSVWGPLH